MRIVCARGGEVDLHCLLGTTLARPQQAGSFSPLIRFFRLCNAWSVQIFLVLAVHSSLAGKTTCVEGGGGGGKGGTGPQVAAKETTRTMGDRPRGASWGAGHW